MTLHLAESLAVRNAVRKHRRICQVGTQIHASENYRRVVEWIRSGKLGKISVARTFNVMNQGPQGLGNVPNGSPPAGLDWDRWVGPYPTRPLQSAHRAKCLYALFVHGVQRRLDARHGPAHHRPSRVGPGTGLSSGNLQFGRAIHDSRRRGCARHAGSHLAVPGLHHDVDDVDGEQFCLRLRSRHARREGLGIYFHGVNGTLWCDYGMHQVIPEGQLLKDAKPPARAIASSPGHEREWLDCIKSRRNRAAVPTTTARSIFRSCWRHLSLKTGSFDSL